MSWFTQQWAVYTPTAPPVTITDTPSAERDYGPDGSLIIDIVLSDTPTGVRFSGPSGSVSIDVVLSDTSVGSRYYGLDGVAQLGISISGDTPGELRTTGPDGLVQPDLVVTDRPSGARAAGPDGFLALGLVFTDTPSAQRLSRPDGSAQADTTGAVSITGDTPSACQYLGPDGLLAIGVTLPGDQPRGVLFSGPDGALIIDIVLTDRPSAERDYGPDGLVISLLGDTPGALRIYGPDGFVRIDLPLAGDRPGATRLAGPAGLVAIGIGAGVIIGPDSPSGVRVGGPDGILLLAILPSKPPYIPVTPTIAPRYELWIADTVTGRLLYELPAAAFSWDSKLNDIGTLRATLVIEDVWDALSDQDERDPRILVREILSGPWRFCLVLKYGTSVPWAGPYLSMTRTVPRQIDLNGAEIQKIFSRRVLINPAATVVTDPTADTVFGPGATKQHVAAALISQALQGTGNSLPITVIDPGGAGIDYRTYYGYDLADYWTVLQNLSAELDGPEIRFDPRIVLQSDGDYINWVVQIGSPHVGRNTTAWVFDNDVNALAELDGDGSRMTLGVWSSGSGQSRDKLISRASDTTLFNIGWPMLDTVDSSHTSEINYPILAAYSTSVLSAHSKPVQSFKVSVPTDINPLVGTYRVGDDFWVDIRQDPLILDGTYMRRIGALSGSEKPWVTITDVDALALGSA